MPIKYIIFSKTDEMNEYAELLSEKGCSVMLACIDENNGWDLEEDDPSERNLNKFFDSKKSSLISVDAMDAIMKLEDISSDDREDYIILCDMDFREIASDIKMLSQEGFNVFSIPIGIKSRREPFVLEQADDDIPANALNDFNGFNGGL